jgi:hypothetical protein
MAKETARAEVVKIGGMIPETWEDLTAVFGDLEELQGDPWEMVDKDRLVATPFVIADFYFSEGDYGTFSIIKVLDESNKKMVFIDGSTGVNAQLQEYAAKHERRGGLVVKRGLRVSEYEYEDEKGRSIPAKTYYLA